MKISIVVPCYNEEEALPLFKTRLDAVAVSLPEDTLSLYLVNDGSADGTRELIDSMVEADPRVIPVRLSRNFGKEAALLAGLACADGDLIAVMDADLQDPPSLLPMMRTMMIETGCDAVAARRVTREGEPRVRSLFARMFYRFMRRISIVHIEDGARDFRLMRREMVHAILRMSEVRRFSKGLFAWVGFDVRYVSYENIARAAGVTKWSFWGLLRYALEGIFSMATLPLALPFLLCVPALAACVVLACIGLGTAAAFCGMAGLILVSLGFVGQYIMRIYWECKKRPLYIRKAPDFGE